MSQSEEVSPGVGYVEGVEVSKVSPTGTDDSSADSSDKSVNDESTDSVSNDDKEDSGDSSSGESTGNESSEEGGGSSSSSEGSFQTVKDTTVVADPDEIETFDIVIPAKAVEPVDSRSKSASPSKAVMKRSQGRASSSPTLVTPDKKAMSPKMASKRLASSSASESTPAKLTSKRGEARTSSKATGSASTDGKTTPPSKAVSKKEPTDASKENKNDVTPKTGRKRDKSRVVVSEDSGLAPPKPAIVKIKSGNKIEVPVQKSSNSSTERKSKEKVKVKVVKRKKSEKDGKEKAVKVRKEKHSSESSKRVKTLSPAKRVKQSSSPESEVEKPAPPIRIPKVSSDRRYQRLAISRAKLCGLIKDGQIRILQITEALKIIDQTKFVVRPTTVCRNYYKCPGTGLPHIRRHLRNWQLKYGALIGKIAKLKLNMALAAERKKLELLDSEACDDYKLIWEFESDVKHSEVAKPQVVCATPVEAVRPDPSPPTKKFKAEVGSGNKSSKRAKKDSDTTDNDTPRSSKKRKKSQSSAKKEGKGSKTSDKEVKSKKDKKTK